MFVFKVFLSLAFFVLLVGCDSKDGNFIHFDNNDSNSTQNGGGTESNNSNNSDSKEQKRDTVAPVITLNRANPYILEAGQAYKEPGAKAIDDRDGEVVVTISGKVESKRVGSYKIDYSAKDSAGNKAEAVRVVKVVDTTAPAIKLNGENPILLQQGATFNDPGVETSDNADGEIKVEVTGIVDSSKAGEYILKYIAIDSSGNRETKERAVKVVMPKDTTAPAIILKGANPFIVELGDSFVDPGATAVDDVDGNVTVKISGTVNTSKVGEYTIIYTAVDSTGNKASKTRVVKVIAKEDNTTVNINSLQEFQKRLDFTKSGRFALVDAPKGMAIFPDGTLSWTPTNEEAGDYSVTVNVQNESGILESKELKFHVSSIEQEYDGVFIDLSGKSGGDGTPQNPFGIFKEACENLNGKYNIYLRGGVYKNPGYHKDYSKSGRYPAIDESCKGSNKHPIVVRPWGNEYVKLKTDALYGIKIKPGAAYITVQNLEIEGEAKAITLNKALKYWWWDDNDTMQSSGIIANGDNIVIKDNIVHDMPGSGISVNAGAYAKIEGNIVYNSDWWTIAGSKGIGITMAKGSDANGEYKNQIVGNLIFNIEQRVMSHVWKKGFATLTIDEGEAFLIQEGKQVDGTSSSSYSGKYLVKDNLILYNGKTGVVNLAKDIDVVNNSYYNNGTMTKQAGFRVSHSKRILIAKNAVESDIKDTLIYSLDRSSSDILLKDNYAKGLIAKDGSKIDGIKSVERLFKNPQSFDFAIEAALPQTTGASKSAIDAIKAKLKLYNIRVQSEHMDINQSEQTEYILKHAPGKIDCSNYPEYIEIKDINSSHRLVRDYNISSFKLFVKEPLDICKEDADTTPPQITLNGDNPMVLNKGETYSEPGAVAADDRDGNVSVTVSGSVDTSKVGEYAVTYKAVDSAGNSRSVTRVVKVILEADTTAPVITLNGDNPMVLNKGETYSEPGAVAADDRDGNVSVTVSGSVDTSKIGEYTIIYTAVDSAGNEVNVSRVVKVKAASSADTTPPVITLNGDNPMGLSLGTVYKEPGASATDDKDGEVAVKIKGNVDNSTLGTYRVKYTAIDSVGNEANATRVVKVVDSLKDAPGVDIAYKFGKATQGTDIFYTYYQPPYYAIDNNDSTYNNTNIGEDGKNWLQIELPNPTQIAKIVLQNRDKFANHLKGAKVYISDMPYNGSLENKQEIATLEPTNDEQVFTFNPPKKANYLLIKGASIKGEKHNIHFRKVEVYGALPVAPAFEKESYYFLIPNATKVGTIVGSVKAVDYQEGKIGYRLLGDVPFSIDDSGNLIVNGKIDGGVYNFEVEANDGEYKRKVTVTVEVTEKDAIEKLLKSGDILHSKVTKQELIDATLQAIEDTKGFLKDAKVQIFNLNSDGTLKDDGNSLSSIDWSLTRAGAIFSPMVGKNTPLLYTNATNGGKKVEHLPAAIIGTKGAGRYALFGANPFVNKSNEQMQKVLENTIVWVSKKDKTKPLKVVLAQQKDRGERKWLDNHFSNASYNDKKACDGAALKGCLDEKPDLLIISQIDDSNNSNAISSAVQDALEDGVGVIYIQTPSGEMTQLGKELLKVFDVRYSANNYFKKLQLQAYNPSSDLEQLDPTVAKINQIFEHFKNKDFAFDWSKCKDKDGDYDENGDDCKEVDGLAEVYESFGATKELIDALGENRIDIFVSDEYRLQKLLVLTADKIRQSVHFPMDKVANDDNEFMESLYADSAVYSFRKINPTQSDLGNFSSSDFSAVTPTTRVVKIKSKVPFRATGAYALPGQTFKITREDSSDVVVKVFINTLRPSATHEFERGGYKRPKNLQSAHIEIKSGETIELTSPYGGPIELEFSKNEADVNIKFENVGEHPFWASSADNESFTKGLNEGIYNWAEIVTESFEVHSRLDKMKESIANPRWDGTAEGLAVAVQKYTANYPYVLAGMKGKGIDVVDEIHDWAGEKELAIKQVDFVKHMNSDQATCGTGCSGNPYDAYWAFDPIGHGDLHEIGHSLQRKDFEGFPIHGATNTFSYYTKSRYFENTGKDGECQSLPFKEVFDIVKESLSKDNPKAYLQKKLWKNVSWKEPYVLKLNLMMHAQKMGKVENGWHILARVHILDREMKRAKLDWENRKDALGFSSYSLDEINNISNNDWLVIAYSYAAGIDFRDFFDMMGIEYSQKAGEQIASFNFQKATKEMMLSTPNGYCKEDKYGRLLDKKTIKVEENANYSKE